jgi:HTH-type transcriptional regulator, sugar sensing transcriptional regulator
LIEKGIVSFIIKEKTKFFQAISPNMLSKFLDRQALEIEENRERLKQIVPELEGYAKSIEEKEEAEIFVGIKGLRTANEKMFADVTKKEKAIFLYVYKKEYAEVIDDFYYNITPFYKERGIKFKGIGSREWAKSEYAKKNSTFIESRYVDFPLPGTIDIYKDFVLEVAWADKPLGILIHSKEIADNYRNYFEELWEIAKKVK